MVRTGSLGLILQDEGCPDILKSNGGMSSSHGADRPRAWQRKTETTY